MADPRPSRPAWNPTRLLRVIESYDTSMGTTKIKTDASLAYIKAMGNRQGPHMLASELIASSLAQWFGLEVPDFAIIDLPSDACFELPRKKRTEPGPAFVSRHVDGRTWGGSAAELRELENPEDITRLVVFDTWVRNCDRHPPDLTKRNPNYANVYLAHTDQPGRSRLVAIDHTHCFDCGKDFSKKLTDIDKVKDESAYGLFPGFGAFVNNGDLAWSKAMLQSLTREVVEAAISKVPAQWEVDAAMRKALATLIHSRASFVADRIEKGWPLNLPV